MGGNIMKNKFSIAISLLIAFVLWTLILLTVNVEPIGPNHSSVGLASINGWFHSLTGVHIALYEMTDWLSLLPLGIVFYFGIIGLCQWIKRRKLTLVDCDILVLGGFYAVVLALFLLFEVLAINHRPILIDGILEASYPSSTTMLVMCVIPTAMMQFQQRIRKPAVRCIILFSLKAFMVLMVFGRLISGVHWLTDIIAGALLSSGLVTLYNGFCHLMYKKSL